ncbi:MAG: PAS domain-containing protein [Rhodobacteraceae bacterium]|nr:PAS domain-containing protein [Paracoccaceae bacterium]
MFGQRKEPQPQDQLLREVHRVAKIGTWEVTADEELLWSDETLDLFGVHPDAFTGSIDEFFGLVHPDDIERLRRLEDFQGSESDYFKSEYRIVRSDGDVRHIRQTAIVLRAGDGTPRGFSGMVQDVSEQIETEARLRQA